MRRTTMTVRELAVGYTAAWCTGDPAKVAAFYSPAGSLGINGGAGATGREKIAESAREFMTAFPDMVVAMDALEPDGERTVYRWTLTGTNTGPGGMGRRVKISGFEEWKIGEDGMIAESKGWFDVEDYQRQSEGK